MKKVKYLILVIVFIIILLGIALGLFLKDKNENSEKYHYDEIINDKETQDMINARYQLHPVDNANEFFKVVNCVNQYLGAVNKFTLNNSGNVDVSQIKSSMQTNIYSILDSEYKTKNKITESNVFDHVDNIDITTFFIPLKMNGLLSKDEQTSRYVVGGILEDMNNKYLKDFYIIVNIDKTNNTFSVEPLLNNKYKSIDEIKINNNSIQIEANKNNKIKEENINDEYISKKYLDYYKKLALGRPDIAYELIDDKYKEKRFGSLEAYKQYIEENRNDTKVIQLQQYMTNREGENTQYICKDKYGKIYMFNEQNPMDLTIQLDTYTIETEEFKKQYQNGNEQVKVQMNINKFILMLNNQDYQAAYNVLDDNFKNNYFKTIDVFKDYVKNNSYKYNDIKFNTMDVKGNVYESGITLTDLTKGAYKDESKGTGGSGYEFSWKIMMQLKDGYDFKISFEV